MLVCTLERTFCGTPYLESWDRELCLQSPKDQSETQYPWEKKRKLTCEKVWGSHPYPNPHSSAENIKYKNKTLPSWANWVSDFK